MSKIKQGRKCRFIYQAHFCRFSSNKSNSTRLSNAAMLDIKMKVEKDALLRYTPKHKRIKPIVLRTAKNIVIEHDRYFVPILPKTWRVQDGGTSRKCQAFLAPFVPSVTCWEF
jgi:hypothetical protein